MSNSLCEGSRTRKTLKKDSAHFKTRDFFKFAADMANPSIKMSSHNNIKSSVKLPIKDAVIISNLLDPTYQKCIYSYNAKSNTTSIAQTMAINPLSMLSAPELHNYFLSHFSERPAQTFFYTTSKGQLIIEQGYLFWANRLKHKSQQSSTGVESGLKYFHAQLHTKTPHAIEINILYWLRFDEHNHPIDGGFVTEEHKNLA